MKGNRLDLLLVEKGLAQSRERAQALILSGNVLVNERPVTKPGTKISESAEIRIRGKDHDYVSRGGLKLEKALDEFQISVQGKTALDVGASTGGFTDVLIQRGALKVYAVDVGHQQLDWKIRSHPNVHVFEKINARYLKADQLGEDFCPVDLIVIDVSFISVTKLLANLLELAHSQTEWVVLIKPQFEVGRDFVGKKGIVTSEEAKEGAIKTIDDFAERLGLIRRGLIKSPIKGTHGNEEFLIYWKRVDDRPKSGV